MVHMFQSVRILQIIPRTHTTHVRHRTQALRHTHESFDMHQTNLRADRSKYNGDFHV